MASKKVDDDKNDFGFLLRRANPIAAENEIDDTDNHLGLGGDSKSNTKGKNAKSHFPLLFNKNDGNKSKA